MNVLVILVELTVLVMLGFSPLIICILISNKKDMGKIKKQDAGEGATYYMLESYQSIGSGGRKENYHCFIQVYNQDKKDIYSIINDKFFGRWAKCAGIIKGWERNAKKAGLERIYPNDPHFSKAVILDPVIYTTNKK